MAKILVETRPLDTRIALIEDGRLAEFFVERESGDGLTGNIYIGRVENVLKGMQSAFVNIGLDKNAFLSVGDFPFASSDFGADEKNIQKALDENDIKKLLNPGQEIPVQIVKLPGGEKGVRISGHISLPGRLCVLLPTVNYIGISKRIEDPAERARLRKMAQKLKPEGIGLVVRTAAEGVSEEEFSGDLEILKREWDMIYKRSRCVKAPALLHHDYDIVYRAIRDHLSKDIDEILIEDRDAYEKALSACKMLAPEMVKKITLSCDDIPLFTRYGIQKQLERALSRRVWLKSGGFLVFDKTEALTVIDVNTGKYTGKNSLEETIFQINTEAAQEIAHQLRLRDIGGIIVIDFIDMRSEEHRSALIDCLREALKADHTHTNVVGLTGLGLVEMTRKRKREPLASYFKNVCPVCSGEGTVFDPESIAVDVFSALSRKAASSESILLATVSRRVFAAMEKLNTPLKGEVYAFQDDKLNDTEFTVAPLLTRELPSGARRIGGANE